MYQDENKDAVEELDVDGNFTFSSPTLSTGIHTFSACYRGDTNFLPAETDNLIIEITGGPDAVTDPYKLDLNAYISDGYLHILNHPHGSTIRLYNYIGQCFTTRISYSNQEIIDVKGFFILVVSYEDKVYSKRFVSEK